MPDSLHRFLIKNLHIRGEWVSLKSSWQQIQNTADYPQPVRNVLGEALVAITLLAESIKFDGSLIMQIRGTSPVTLLVVQASSDGAIRGIAHWDGDIPEDASFNDLFGNGTMVISVQNKPKKGQQQGERYQSLVSLEGASLRECLSAYFAQSEQLKTTMWLAVTDQCAAGILLQSLPEEGDGNDVNNGNNLENWEHASILADTLNSDKGRQELVTLNAEELLYRLYHEEELILYEAKSIRFECSCSQQKVENTIVTLGEKEANSILEEQGSISIDCEFCNKHYQLDPVDVARLFHENAIGGSSNGSGRVH